MVLEVRDGEKYTYPVDSSYGLHCIAEELKHHEGEKPLSPAIKSLGEIAHLISKQINNEIMENIKKEKKNG